MRATTPSTSRSDLRKIIRARRQSLTACEQQQAASDLLHHFQRAESIQQAKRIALYLSVDGELDTQPLIAHCCAKAKTSICQLSILSAKAIFFSCITGQIQCWCQTATVF